MNEIQNDQEMSPELTELLANTAPVSELDLEGLAESVAALRRDPKHVAEVAKGIFVEDVLRVMEARSINQSQLAKQLGKSPQWINKVLDSEKLNNFTIDSMATISVALGCELHIRMNTPSEKLDPINKNKD